jgi:hypothetical protein
VTVKVMVPAASLIVTSLTLRDGVASLSWIVPVPVAPPAAVTTRVSSCSSSVSPTVAIVAVKLVTPAGMTRLVPDRVTPFVNVGTTP